MSQSADVLSNDVELDVNHRSWLDAMEIGELVGVRDDVDLEGVVGGITYSKAHAIHRDRSLIYCEITTLGHFLVEIVLECEGITTLLVFLSGADSRLINMALNDMSVEPAIHHHATLHIDMVANLEQTEVRSVKRFFHRRDGISPVLNLHHSEANAIVSDALVDGQFIYKRALEVEINIFLIFIDAHDSGKFFYDT